MPDISQQMIWREGIKQRNGKSSYDADIKGTKRYKRGEGDEAKSENEK